eukprot:399916_1
MIGFISAITGLSEDSLLICFIVLFIMTILTIVFAATKPKQRISPSSINTPKRSKKTKHLRGKHEFVHRPSILDTGMAMVVPWRKDTPRSNIMKKSVFRGWYNLCWIMGASWLLQYFMNNYKTSGSIIGNLNFGISLFYLLHELLLMLLPVYALSFSAFFLEKLMSQQIFGNKYTRLILHAVQHTVQTILIFGVGTFVFFFCEHWPFTQKFALIVETLCLYMKMHSYMLSNQELYDMKYGINSNNKKTDISESDDTIKTVQDVNKISDERVIKELGFRGLRDFSSVNMKTTLPANFCYYVNDDTQVDIYGFSSCYKNRSTSVYSHQYPIRTTNTSTNVSTSASSLNSESTTPISELFTTTNGEIKKLHAEIKKLKEIESSQLEGTYRRMVLKDSIFLENYRKQIYPQNVTLYNWVEFTWFPTLVYEPLYPRTSSVRILYIVEKICLSLFIMSFMFAIVEKFMLKSLSQASQYEPVVSIINLLVPATLVEIAGFFVVFDCMMNCIAELTCFADREFYQDWWNSTSFEEFARKWNRPVHEFLLRHVYYESMSTYKLSKGIALAGTFVFSITLHEVVLTVCLHKFSPWLAFLSLMQLPLMPIMKSPAFKNKPLGNIVFWAGIILGMPMTMVLYARDYCSAYDCST